MTESSPFRRGFMSACGLPALVLFSSMVGFGTLASEASLDLLPTIVTTIGIWGLPGQMVMVEMVAFGAPVFAIALAVSVANARFLPMTLAITPYLTNWRVSWIRRLLFAQLVTLTPWAMALQRWPSMPQ
ncbi:MAG: AzlC family ABC transporter permease, partial [Rhodospirillales bacterium]|nr:AzlC family ABC transporter permease [Rhodospirillales bacterium]